MSVSQDWKKAASHATLWKDLRFGVGIRAINLSVLRHVLVDLSQTKARSVAIACSGSFQLTSQKLLTIGDKLPSLESLFIRCTRPCATGPVSTLPILASSFSKLRRLQLLGPMPPNPILHIITAHPSCHLRELKITYAHPSIENCFPQMDFLEVLELVGCTARLSDSIAARFPLVSPRG